MLCQARVSAEQSFGRVGVLNLGAEAIPNAWPENPYLGLDFYRESDAALFRERDGEVRECADLLLGYGLKFLLLHGSSGCGKSSFLRAGLIPYLKRHTLPLCFLNSDDTVIRCTEDPLRALARSLRLAVDQPKVFADTLASSDGGPHVDQNARERIRQQLSLESEGLADLGTRLLDTLMDLSADLPGKLVILLDQAEEVLTRALDDPEAVAVPASRFFRFLEEIYIRNLDIRIVLTLRTEYYGRFRDELQISDSRLGQRPATGGIQPFLLRSLRDRLKLAAIVTAPTEARVDDSSVYKFSYLPGVVDVVVADLLREFPTSITPALQVVCAALYAQLTTTKRQIAVEDYETLGKVRGIVRSYVELGINSVSPRGRDETDNWYLLLHSLVSRQGGGTVVSLTEPLDVLTARGEELKLGDDISRRLLLMTRGTHPMLRAGGNGPALLFSLKHDVLAVILSRWFDEYGGAIRARVEERRKRRWIVLASLSVVGAILLAAGWIIFDRSRSLASVKADAIDFRNAYARGAEERNYDRSILALLYNLEQTEHAVSVYDRIAGSNRSGRAKTIDAFRDVLRRAPRFVSRGRAIGLDTDTGAILVLQRDTLRIYDLATSGAQLDWPNHEDHALPVGEEWTSSMSVPSPAIGVVRGIGPVALVDGKAFFWKDGERQARNVWAATLAKYPDFGQPWPAFPSFAAGKLILQKPTAGGGTSQILRFGTQELAGNDVVIPEPASLTVTRHISGAAPLLSEGVGVAQRYGALDEDVKASAGNVAVAEDVPAGSRWAGLDLVFGDLDGGSKIENRELVARVPHQVGIPERQIATFAFAPNADAAIVKLDGNHDFEIVDLSRGTAGSTDAGRSRSPEIVKVEAAGSEHLGQSGVFWQLPPLAAIRVGEHWRVAWPYRYAVFVVENDETPSVARSSLGGPLLSAPSREGVPPLGRKLQFTAGGDFLVMIDTQQVGASNVVRVWDLRAAWREWTDSASDEDLRAVGRKIVEADRGGCKFVGDEKAVLQVKATNDGLCDEDNRE